MPRAEPTYKYLDIPDDMLDAVQLKEKRKERLFKGAHDARERARAAKLVEQRAKVIQRSWPARHRSHTRDEPDARACTGCHTLARRTRSARRSSCGRRIWRGGAPRRGKSAPSSWRGCVKRRSGYVPVARRPSRTPARVC